MLSVNMSAKCTVNKPHNSRSDKAGTFGWLRGTVVERRSLTGKLSLPALDLQLTGDHLCE